MAGIYIHIPFCAKKCRYCDFVSFAGIKDTSAYTAALISEMRIFAPLVKGRHFETVYIGGGTPTVMPQGIISRILSEAGKLFDISGDAEISIECNPESVTEEKLSEYRSAGINRLSIGLQSADNEVLKAVGRIHTAERFLEAYNTAEKCGFTNINADIMHGLPKQTLSSYLDTIGFLGKLRPTHISSYSLILEEGTPLYNDIAEGREEAPDSDLAADMEDAGFDALAALGYERYEISNFAKPGFECRHNLNYWNNGEYLGLGLNSHSAMRINNKWMRWANKSDLSDYIIDAANGRLPVAETKEIPREEEMFENVMLELRKTAGLDRKAFEARFGIDPVTNYASAVSEAILEGNMVCDENTVKLTKKGLDFQNEVLLKFM